MNSLAVEKAWSRLSGARSAVESLENCNIFSRYRELWYVFLCSTKSIYTVLEQGAKVSPHSMQWFEGVRTARREDQLLEYLYQARNDDEHGLSAVIAHDKTFAVVQMPNSKHKLTVRASYDREPTSDSSITLETVNGIPIPKEHRYPYVRLIRVHGRGKKPYDPPVVHLEHPIENPNPIKVATLGIAYWKGVIERAERFSCPPSQSLPGREGGIP